MASTRIEGIGFLAQAAQDELTQEIRRHRIEGGRMTPEERAAQLAGQWYVNRRNGAVFFSENMRADFVEKQIAAAIREAVEVEREACAKICDAADNPWSAASSIRARGLVGAERVTK